MPKPRRIPPPTKCVATPQRRNPPLHSGSPPARAPDGPIRPDQTVEYLARQLGLSIKTVVRTFGTLGIDARKGNDELSPIDMARVVDYCRRFVLKLTEASTQTPTATPPATEAKPIPKVRGVRFNSVVPAAKPVLMRVFNEKWVSTI